MKFRPDRPIFRQIVERVEEEIVRGELPGEARVPAVRDFAVAMEVNPNTIMRSFLELEQTGVLFKKRGIGYFVSPDAKSRIIVRRRRVFLHEELPELVKKMRLLNVGLDVFSDYFAKDNPDETAYRKVSHEKE